MVGWLGLAMLFERSQLGISSSRYLDFIVWPASTVLCQQLEHSYITCLQGTALENTGEEKFRDQLSISSYILCLFPPLFAHLGKRLCTECETLHATYPFGVVYSAPVNVNA